MDIGTTSITRETTVSIDRYTIIFGNNVTQVFYFKGGNLVDQSKFPDSEFKFQRAIPDLHYFIRRIKAYKILSNQQLEEVVNLASSAFQLEEVIKNSDIVNMSLRYYNILIKATVKIIDRIASVINIELQTALVDQIHNIAAIDWTRSARLVDNCTIPKYSVYLNRKDYDLLMNDEVLYDGTVFMQKISIGRPIFRFSLSDPSGLCKTAVKSYSLIDSQSQEDLVKIEAIDLDPFIKNGVVNVFNRYFGLKESPGLN